MGVDPNKMLTKRQRQLLSLIEDRKRHRLPVVQQDLAEALGIRRESVNKLLKRMRIRLNRRGEVLEMPDRRGRVVASVGTLADGARL